MGERLQAPSERIMEMCKKRNVYTMSELSLSLTNTYNKLNADLFGGELPKVIITFEPGQKQGTFGWIYDKKNWVQGKEERYNINISSDYLNRPASDIVGTLVHEMCHLYALVNGIKDTSRGNTYHNKKFAEIANNHMLVAFEVEHIGYSTKPSEQLIEWTNENCPFTSIRLTKKLEPEKQGKSDKPKQSMRKYICPQCGLIIRATKDCRVMCIECQKEMEKEI